MEIERDGNSTDCLGKEVKKNNKLRIYARINNLGKPKNKTTNKLNSGPYKEEVDLILYSKLI